MLLLYLVHLRPLIGLRKSGRANCEGGGIGGTSGNGDIGVVGILEEGTRDAKKTPESRQADRHEGSWKYDIRNWKKVKNPRQNVDD